MNTLTMVLAGVVLVALLAFGVLLLSFLNLWLQAKASGVQVGLMDMLMMRLRRVDPILVVNAMVSMSKAGVDVPLGALEAHVLAGGNLSGVANAVIAAEKAGLGADFRRLAAIDLCGRDVAAAVNARVNPRVLLCPPAGSEAAAISGVAQDGVRLSVTARVTVRTRMDRLVGGAGEDTVVARVGEGIVTAIGRARSHREILARPETITQYLLAKGLDSGTCFEILSVDIADVDVRDNVGARLKAAQADADKRIAQAQAEMRRTAAVASHQEMTARTLDMTSRVVAARAVVPLAAAAALKEANLGRVAPLPPSLNPRLRWKRGSR